MPYNEFFDLVDKGGLLVWPILLCSLIGMSIFIERLLFFRKIEKFSSSNDLQGIFQLLRAGRHEHALLEAQKQTNPFDAGNRIVLEALSVENPDRETLEMVLVHGVDREVTTLSRHLNTLGVLASSAPLLGLLGTVMGMIKAFIVVQSMGGSVNASVLAGGIWEAMLTTAMGLLVAIPLLFFHNLLESKIRLLQSSLEEVAISYIKAWSRHAPHRVN